MGMVLNTNIPSIQAQRALGESRKEMELAMERLSTGSRINSAGDDAAGLAIVERMNTQIRGLGQATRNANDGIALIKTVENALVEVSGMLQRMRELAVQAANDTNTATERAFADNEVSSLQLEISRVSLNTRYNGAQVLNGSFAAKSLQVGTEAGETLDFSIGNIEASKLGAYIIDGVTTTAVASSSTATDPTNSAVDADDITITSFGTSRTIDVEANDTAKAVAKKVNAVAASTQVIGSAASYAIFSTATASTSNTGRLKINGTETASFTMTSNDVSDAIQKINAISTTTGVQASSTNNKVLLKDADGDDIVLINTSARTDLKVQAVGIDGLTVGGSELTFTASGTGTDTVNVRGNLKLSSNLDFKIAQANATSFFTSGDTSAPLVNVGTVSVLTQIKASNALAIIDGAIETVSSLRGSLGTLQNRLDYTVSNLLKVTEFTTAARSRIADADFAAETARLAKAQVLQQAGASMLSQANASTDTVLQLLRG
jgi:flagellin